MKRSFAFAVLLLGLGLAAGGCASSPDDSSQGAGGGGTLDGSCTITFSDGTMSCSEDYHNSPAWMKQQCSEASSAGGTPTYSAGHCSTDGLTGKCTLWDWVDFYYNESDEAATLQNYCTNNGGTWSTS